jgi:hypothetical protein
MIAISRSFTKRMRRPRSSLSASCPEVAEKSRKGAMKMAPMRNPAVDASTSPHSAAW